MATVKFFNGYDITPYPLIPIEKLMEVSQVTKFVDSTGKIRNVATRNILPGNVYFHNMEVRDNELSSNPFSFSVYNKYTKKLSFYFEKTHLGLWKMTKENTTRLFVEAGENDICGFFPVICVAQNSSENGDIYTIESMSMINEKPMSEFTNKTIRHFGVEWFLSNVKTPVQSSGVYLGANGYKHDGASIPVVKIKIAEHGSEPVYPTEPGKINYLLSPSDLLDPDKEMLSLTHYYGVKQTLPTMRISLSKLL